MKVKVKNLVPNPYRHMDRYPIDPERVGALKTSIGETEFWDNILARKKGGVFEIAYGHHRLIALQELGIKEVDIPVKKLSDAVMLRIMANENMSEWGSRPAVINETVYAAKMYLDGELAKWDDLKSADKNISRLFDSQASFGAAKKGVGRETLLKFLGGNWKPWIIQEALDNLGYGEHGEDISREAIEQFATMEQSRQFKRVVREHEIPKDEQKHLARVLSKEGASKREIPALIEEFVSKKEKKVKTLPHLEDVMKKVTARMISVCETLERVKKYVDDCSKPMVKEKFMIVGSNLREVVDSMFPEEVAE